MWQSLAVFGAGSVGLAAVMAARAIGLTTIIAVDLLDERLGLARELGATHTLNPRDEPELVARIKSISASGVNYSFDTTGAARVLRQAVEALAPRGTCGFVGAAALDTEVSLNVMDIMTQGKKLRGIVEGDATPEVFIPQLIALQAQGRFPFEKLIAFYPFDRINDAVHDSETGKVVKAIVCMPA